jgi:hypothetical protein
MTHIKYEDLKLALEALESTRIIDFSVEDIVSWKKAITAFKQALAAPVQEPVAKIVINTAGRQISIQTPEGDVFDVSKHVGAVLYTTPQQRPWVGLTTEQISNEVISDKPDFAVGFTEGAMWADAKLKEKNT